MFSALKALPTNRIAIVAIIVCAAVTLAHAAEDPELAPATAKTAIDSTADALADLFTKECVEQRNLEWVRAESARVVGTCRAVPAGPGETQDCEEDLEGHVAWIIPTKSGSDVSIEMWLNTADPRKKAFCSLSVPASLGEALKQAAAQISVPHEFRQRDPSESEFGMRFDVRGQWEGYFMRLIREHPYVLENRTGPQSSSSS